MGMSNDIRHRLGAQGEQLAVEHLQRLGLRVVDRNVRTRTGELDIVAVDDTTVVFCEVKTRRAGHAANPFDGLYPDQCRRIRTLAVAWLSGAGRGVRRPTVRFDAIGITIDGQGRLQSLEHLEGCF